MPNGFYGSKEEWERLVAPLRELDAELAEFAGRHGIAIDQNYHNIPNRMLHWVQDGIRRQIQISLYGDRLILLSYAAWRDAAGQRRGTRWPPKMDIPLDVFKSNVSQLLEEARTHLQGVTDDDLEYWTHLSS